MPSVCAHHTLCRQRQTNIGSFNVNTAKEEQEQIARASVDVLLECQAAHKAKKNSIDIDLAILKAFAAAASVKHSGFEGEAEWRLVKVVPIEPHTCKDISFRLGRNGLVPYTEAPLTDSGQLVPEVINIGPTGDMLAAKAAVATLLASHGLRVSGKSAIQIQCSKTPFRP